MPRLWLFRRRRTLACALPAAAMAGEEGYAKLRMGMFLSEISTMLVGANNRSSDSPPYPASPRNIAIGAGVAATDVPAGLSEVDSRSEPSDYRRPKSEDPHVSIEIRKEPGRAEHSSWAPCPCGATEISF
jgi:hypothetical protein